VNQPRTNLLWPGQGLLRREPGAGLLSWVLQPHSGYLSSEYIMGTSVFRGWQWSEGPSTVHQTGKNVTYVIENKHIVVFWREAKIFFEIL